MLLFTTENYFYSSFSLKNQTLKVEEFGGKTFWKLKSRNEHLAFWLKHQLFRTKMGLGCTIRSTVFDADTPRVTDAIPEGGVYSK